MNIDYFEELFKLDYTLRKFYIKNYYTTVAANHEVIIQIFTMFFIYKT